ncbi:TetR/AcrR family transcriptional regulator [Streptomyces sp. QTS137]
MNDDREAGAVAERGLETKYRIAETAMALFLEQGYESVTVEAVADASRVSRRTVFRYFDGKDELAFPDHSARLELLARHLVEPTPKRSAVDVVIAATEVVMLDFLSRPELVLRRFKLTRIVPELRRREVLENERYVSLTRGYLRDHLPADRPPFLPMALSALIDSMHRSALGDFARSGGTADAYAELKEGMEWVRRALAEEPGAGGPLLFAVLPDTAAARRSLAALRDEAQDLF